MIVKIAWRNIWRNKKRSIIIMCAISLGLWMGIFLMGFYNGMIEERIKNAISSEISHIQIHHPEFKKDFDLKYFLPDGLKMIEKLKKQDEISELAGRIIAKGMIVSSVGTSGITINAIEPQAEKKVSGLEKKISEGNYFTTKKRNELIVSEKLAKKLHLKLNKKAIVTFQCKDGELASIAFRIIALYKTSNGPYDDNNIFVNIKSIDSLAGIFHEINEIAILLKSNELLFQSESAIKKTYPNTKVENWMKISPELGLALSVGDQMVYAFMGIILLALAFGIVNTMMMAVIERTKEIGILIALGMNKVKIFFMLLFETFFLILAGCPIGLLLGFITIYITNHTGIDFSERLEVYSSFGISRIIYPSIKISQFGVIMLLVLTTALFSALLPARRAVKLNPADAIKK